MKAPGLVFFKTETNQRCPGNKPNFIIILINIKKSAKSDTCVITESTETKLKEPFAIYQSKTPKINKEVINIFPKKKNKELAKTEKDSFLNPITQRVLNAESSNKINNNKKFNSAISEQQI